ncbi:MAG: hypothetical protein AB7N99_09670 [Simkaniaceae bacterium]
MSALKDLRPFSPSGFFQVRTKIHRGGRKQVLPDTTGLLVEEKFADLAVSWSPEGLSFTAQVKKIPEEGDYLELFIDTRDLKTTNSITRFCHHFLFYPEEVEGVQALEVTRFRGEDKHELADSSLFIVDTTVKRASYEMEIGIPQEALHGYNPSEFKRLGFCYRFVRKEGAPQHFGISSRFFALEKHPELWATLELT